MNMIKEKGLTNILLAIFTRNEEDEIIEGIELVHIILIEGIIDQHIVLTTFKKCIICSGSGSYELNNRHELVNIT